MLRFALTAPALAASGAAAAAAAPNIILFLADDMGYGDLSVTGHPTIMSPNIDRLAAEGMRLTQFYTGHPLCTPSRTSILTGRYASRSGMNPGWTGGVLAGDAEGGLPLNETTLANALKAAGYDTAITGKWHLGQREMYLPTNRGFDSYLGVPFSVDMGLSPLEPDAWTQNQTTLPLIDGTAIIEQPVNFANLTGRYVDRVLSVLAAHGTEARKAGVQGSSNPFFMYVPFNHVHVPMFISPQNNGTSPRGPFGDNVRVSSSSKGRPAGSKR